METSSSSSSSSSKVEDVRQSMHENARRKRDAARAKAKKWRARGSATGWSPSARRRSAGARVAVGALAAAAKKRFATSQA